VSSLRPPAVDPRGADLKRYLQEEPGVPVVMLNLLRYAEGCRELYAQYARALSETFHPRYGGECSTPATGPHLGGE
jgi:hypothetical protein